MVDEANSIYATTLNDMAWRLATDPDPDRRNSAAALLDAKLAVESQPDNAVFLKTLGVARYRKADFPAAIGDLERCIKLGGFNAQAAFFLSAAHAQLGHFEQARKLYQEADEWMRLNQADDTKLERFREEAAAVLYVTSVDASKTQANEKDPAVQKLGGTTGAPKQTTRSSGLIRRHCGAAVRLRPGRAKMGCGFAAVEGWNHEGSKDHRCWP